MLCTRAACSLVVLSFLVPACRSRAPQSPGPEITSVAVPPPADLGRGASRVEVEGAYRIQVADAVRRVCSGTAPFFELDSSETRDLDQGTIHTLAECMISGPLRDQRIRLVGRTDPRGTPTYNERLGRERAERVKRHLVEQGVDASRIEVDSAGEDRASASPQDWPTDRRVDVELVR